MIALAKCRKTCQHLKSLLYSIKWMKCDANKRNYQCKLSNVFLHAFRSTLKSMAVMMEMCVSNDGDVCVCPFWLRYKKGPPQNALILVFELLYRGVCACGRIFLMDSHSVSLMPSICWRHKTIAEPFYRNPNSNQLGINHDFYGNTFFFFWFRLREIGVYLSRRLLCIGISSQTSKWTTYTHSV